MGQYRKIRTRIRGVQNTAKITQAMKMVAAAKLRRAQDAIIQARPYAGKLREILGHLAESMETAISPYFQQRETHRVGIVVVTADRGLCGPFNSNVLKAAQHRVRNTYGEVNKAGAVELICVGKRSVDFFDKRGYNVVNKYPGIFNDLNFAVAQKIVGEIQDKFLEGHYDKVELIHNEFRSVIRQKIAVNQFLPVEPIVSGERAKTASGYNIEYIFEPSSVELLNALIPKHLNTQMWNGLLESNAAEHGARMTAMDNATRNAKDLARDLKLEYNKARQAAITTEILEIVSGANALEG
ncbi:MAG: ATP synthase F1 subunit gamma [Chlorobi bacterium]|nr:ATP synthase F1 subunit gamma [Chlorobiota bacterium]